MSALPILNAGQVRDDLHRRAARLKGRPAEQIDNLGRLEADAKRHAPDLRRSLLVKSGAVKRARKPGPRKPPQPYPVLAEGFKACTHEEAVAAALAHPDIAAFIADPQHPKTEASERRAPAVYVRFEQGGCVGDLGGALAACKHKRSFGRLVAIEPVPPEIVLFSRFYTFVFPRTNRLAWKVEQRREFKRRLPKDRRRIVNAVYEERQGGPGWKKHFEAKDPRNAADLAFACKRFRCNPDVFYRLVHGEERYLFPAVETQKDLFEE